MPDVGTYLQPSSHQTIHNPTPDEFQTISRLDSIEIRMHCGFGTKYSVPRLYCPLGNLPILMQNGLSCASHTVMSCRDSQNYLHNDNLDLDCLSGSQTGSRASRPVLDLLQRLFSYAYSDYCMLATAYRQFVHTSLIGSLGNINFRGFARRAKYLFAIFSGI